MLLRNGGAMAARGLRLFAGSALVAALLLFGSCRRTDHTSRPRLDLDHDGISDLMESNLLTRFRPFYRFSLNDGEDEDWHPADASWFVARSDLQDHHSETDTPIIDKSILSADPTFILSASSKGPSNAALSASISDYYLNLQNSARHGEPDWSVIQQDATGLYGHVAPLHQDGSDPGKITGYKIEYWQLYAYDAVPGQTDCNKYSDSHEGDWVSVELVIEPDQHTIRRVRNGVHSASVTFDLANGTPVDIGGGVREYRGTGTGKPYSGYIDLNVAGPAGIGWAQDNLLRLFCDREGCTHPIVYIEHAGHEAWPTQYWNWPVVYAHEGDSPHAYLVSTPKNVGEIGAPMPNCGDCALVVGFNGHWGACGKDPPEGPPVVPGKWGQP
jgi:hypothetical protein